MPVAAPRVLASCFCLAFVELDANCIRCMLCVVELDANCIAKNLLNSVYS
jgi:hypothetical protein